MTSDSTFFNWHGAGRGKGFYLYVTTPHLEAHHIGTTFPLRPLGGANRHARRAAAKTGKVTWPWRVKVGDDVSEGTGDSQSESRRAAEKAARKMLGGE